MRITVHDLDWRSTKSRVIDGERAVVTFDNGYSASVLRGGAGYSGNGSYEIAVMRNGHLDYTTPIASDVLRYLSEDEANQTLADIAALPVPA